MLAMNSLNSQHGARHLPRHRLPSPSTPFRSALTYTRQANGLLPNIAALPELATILSTSAQYHSAVVAASTASQLGSGQFLATLPILTDSLSSLSDLAPMLGSGPAAADVEFTAELARTTQPDGGGFQFQFLNGLPALRDAMTLLTLDIASLAQFQPTLPGLARLSPNPLLGILDFYIIGPLYGALGKAYRSSDFLLRDKLGGGNFGTAFEGLLLKAGEGTQLVKARLSDAQKERRVVMKKVDGDGAMRVDFLKFGTVASGGAETAQVESYMCSKIKRNLSARTSCAEYLGFFVVEQSRGGGQYTEGSQWLIWKYESDSTLG
eukprot:gene719-2143_t